MEAGKPASVMVYGHPVSIRDDSSPWVSVVGLLVALTGLSIVGYASTWWVFLDYFGSMGMTVISVVIGPNIGVGVLLLVAGGGLAKSRTWAWWLAMFTAVVAIFLTMSDTMSVLDCLARGPRSCTPKYFYPVPVIVTTMAAMSVASLATVFQHFWRRGTARM